MCHNYPCCIDPETVNIAVLLPSGLSTIVLVPGATVNLALEASPEGTFINTIPLPPDNPVGGAVLISSPPAPPPVLICPASAAITGVPGVPQPGGLTPKRLPLPPPP
jgi:hypothetical protein